MKKNIYSSIFLSLLLVIIVTAPALASGKLYFGTENGIFGSCSLDGGGVENLARLESESDYHDFYALERDPGGNFYAAYGNAIYKLTPAGKVLWSFSGHNDDINELAVDSTGAIYTASDDGTVKKISAAEELLWTFNGHDGRVRAITAAGKYIYTASLDGTVRKLDREGREIWRYYRDDLEPYSVLVDKEGNIYAGFDNGLIHKISKNGEHLWSTVYQDYVEEIIKIAFDSKGNIIASDAGGFMRKILPGGKIVGTLYLEREPGEARVYDFAVIRDNSVYIACNEKRLIKLDGYGNIDRIMSDISVEPQQIVVEGGS